MLVIQKAIVDGEYDEHHSINSDEGDWDFFGAGPAHNFITDNAHRPSRPVADEKSRFTSLESGTANGNVFPSMHIIK